MLFSSLSFLFVFLPCVLGIDHVLKDQYRNYFLFVASIIFYAWGEPKFVFVMLTSIAMNYLFGLSLECAKEALRRWILTIAVIMNLLILFIFKYLNFAASNLDKIFTDLVPQFDIVLPIGISFFTFQAMSYVIDVYRGQAKAQKNPFFLGLYIALFPQLIAGPIVRYTEIERQIYNRTITPDSFGDGVRRFLIGFSKKVLIANNIALIADWSYETIGSGSGSVICAWLGAISYALQIYFDFGGYSDMAIGLGKMLGFQFQENFIYPYSKGSMKGFWSENHISLCNWFRDYVYIPLGGSRGSTIKTIRNLFVVWAITGIWHGADWVFLFWGLIYFAILVFEKYTKIPDRFEGKAGKVIYRIFTLVMLVILNGVLFRDVGLNATLHYISSMFGTAGLPIFSTDVLFYLHEYGVFLAFAIVYSTSAFRYIKNRIVKNNQYLNIFSGISIVVYMVLFLVGISYLVLGSYNPFIYFNF
ncbi:MBOAT family protein [Eubacterium sp. AB3007]|uniref:MBOAT family O-acyltransferase n=1 Tax=Eubacterium sp. AB3007 TaxID=1392487 RepID=UPI000485AFC4|nr:MBOAT family O-acyltransferase [Eubacterium sp. AB3007]